ncbi:MAG: hypothetical protein LJE91_07915 [Gammaproteobacteria bacterium]|nr:hypothetical protein [Gammaproteobacteria bacterium]
MQLHYFLNTKPQYRQFVDKADLIWMLPVFWIGFKILVFPGLAAARRYGALPVMGAAAMIGSAALVGCISASSLLVFSSVLCVATTVPSLDDAPDVAP